MIQLFYFYGLNKLIILYKEIMQYYKLIYRSHMKTILIFQIE